MELLLMCGIMLATFHTSQCQSDIPEYCKLPSDAGTGSNLGPATYYDAADDLCYPFLYKGEEGNQNRFTSEIECIRTCSPKAEEKYPKDEINACWLPLLKGSLCNGNNVRYFYDRFHDKCKRFQWKGCMGNGNRFLTEEMCNQTCNGVHENGDVPEEEEHDTPVAIICLSVFGVLGAILIIVVIVLAVKSKDEPKKAPKKPKREDIPLRVSAIEVE